MATSVDTEAPAQLGKLELWETGRRLLGYGDWAPSDDGEPYLKWAGMQSHRLFLSMRKRQASQADFLLCVDYCHRNHIRIENAIWVFKYYNDACKEQRDLAREAPSDIQHLIERAVLRERAVIPGIADEIDWIGRLTRAQGGYRREVLESWAQTRRIDLSNL